MLENPSSSNDMFITLHYDSRSINHSLPLTHGYSASVDADFETSTHKLREGEKNSHDFVAESHKFIVEGNQTNDNYATLSHRYTVNFAKSCYTGIEAGNVDYYDFEYRDSGACFYRNSIFSCGDQHQNWFGIIPNDGALAISLVKTSVYFKSNCNVPLSESKQSHPNTADDSCQEDNSGKNLMTLKKKTENKDHRTSLNYLPAWLVIVRREKGSDLRGCVINKLLLENNKHICSLIIHEPNTNNSNIPNISNNPIVSTMMTDINNNNNNNNNNLTTEAESFRTNLPTTKYTSLTTTAVSTATALTTSGISNSSQTTPKSKKSSKKNSTKSNDTLLNITEEQLVLKYLVKNENVMDYLKPGVPDRSVYEKLLKLDEMELLNNHKFGVLLCRRNQSTEEEMYNNEHSTPEFEEFLKLLGRKVRLRNYSGYIGGLDYRNDSTGLETYVTEFRGTNIVFLVSTLLPYEPNKIEQLARKRHIGNSSVTFIFVEEGAKPFQPDTIISGFQKVLIIVKYIRLNHNENNNCKFAYRVAVCRAKEVPPFGPVISSDYLFEHHTSFANLLLIKAINAAYAVLKYSKFREIMQRSRRDYLHQFCTEHTISAENENIKHGKMHIYRRHSQDKLKQLKNSIKSLGSTTPSVDREITPTKFQLDKIISFNHITGILQINNSFNNNNNNLSNLKSYDDLYRIHQRVKRNHSDVLKSNQDYFDHLEKNSENIHLSSTFHNLLDFGQSIYVGLKKWQKVDGWHSVMELLPNSLLNNNNNVDVDEHSLYNFIYLPITHNHYFETQIGINRNWLLIFAPYTISSHLANRILLAIPLVSIFAYLFEHNRKVLRIYFDCGQYVQIQDIYNSYNLNGQNILEQLINFISYCIYPKVLQKCSQIMMKIKNTSNNVTNDDDNEKLFINDINEANNNYYDKPQNSIQTTNHFNTIKHSTNNNNKCWSISEMGLSLSCLSPIDNYNILNSLRTSSSSSITTIVPSLSSYSHSPLSLNPFPYILNFQKTPSDFHLFKQKNQIILQIGSYHLPELIRTIQSRKSLWCLQKLNLFAPFFNFYFPLIYDLQFSTHLLSLINKLKFPTTFKMILCDLPKIEILNRARIRYRRQQYVKHYVNNNIRKELRFSYPQANISVNHQHQHQHHHHHKNNNQHDESVHCCENYKETNDSNTISLLSNSVPIGLPHIIHVSNVYSKQNMHTVKNLQVSSDVRTTDRSKYYSLDVQQMFPTDLYTNSQHHQNDNSLTTKNDNETSTDFTSNVVPTMDLIETANYVQSRRRTRKPELILVKKSNHVCASTVDQSLNKELHLTNRQEIIISNENNEARQDRNKIHDRSGSYPSITNDQNPSSTLRNGIVHIANKSTDKSNLSASTLAKMNPESNNTNDLSTDNSPSLTLNVKPNMPVSVKWRRAITEKGNLSHNTDAKIVTIRRRIDTTEINTWNTKAHENTTLNKLEQIRSSSLTVDNTTKLTNTSTDYIPPMKPKSRLTITKETFRQPQNTMKFSNTAMNQYNTETKQHLRNHQMIDSTGLSENELRDRLKKISEELHMEQYRRNHLANMCADLLEENRKLRYGQSDNMNKRQEQPIITIHTATTVPTTTTTTLKDEHNEPIYKSHNIKKVKLGFINGKIKQVSSNPSIWRKSKLKSQSFINGTDL